MGSLARMFGALKMERVVFTSITSHLSLLDISANLEVRFSSLPPSSANSKSLTIPAKVIQHIHLPPSIHPCPHQSFILSMHILGNSANDQDLASHKYAKHVLN